MVKATTPATAIIPQETGGPRPAPSLDNNNSPRDSDPGAISGWSVHGEPNKLAMLSQQPNQCLGGEMADTLCSGHSALRGVRVRLLSQALHAPVAQLVERALYTGKVGGSSPSRSTELESQGGARLS